MIILEVVVKLENINNDPLEGSYYDGGSNDDDESCGNNILYENRLDEDLNPYHGLKVSLQQVLFILFCLMGTNLAHT